MLIVLKHRVADIQRKYLGFIIGIKIAVNIGIIDIGIKQNCLFRIRVE